MAQEEQTEGKSRSSLGQVYERIYKVEGEVSEIREQLAGIGVNVQALTASMSKIAQTIEQSRATDWKGLAAWATVVLMILTAGGAMILQPMRNEMTSTRANVDRLKENRIVDARVQIEDQARLLKEAEERGRYHEKVDRNERDLFDQMKRPIR